jgi:hypothetical protein
VLGWQFGHCLVTRWDLTFTTRLGSSTSRCLRQSEIACLIPAVLVLLLISHGGASRFLRGDESDLIRGELGTRDHIVIASPLAVVLALRCHLGELRLDRIVRIWPALRWDQTSSLLIVKSLRLVIKLPRAFGWTFEVADWGFRNVVGAVSWVSSRPFSVALLRLVPSVGVLVASILRRAFERELTLVNGNNWIHKVLKG